MWVVLGRHRVDLCACGVVVSEREVYLVWDVSHYEDPVLHSVWATLESAQAEVRRVKGRNCWAELRVDSEVVRS